MHALAPITFNSAHIQSQKAAMRRDAKYGIFRRLAISNTLVSSLQFQVFAFSMMKTFKSFLLIVGGCVIIATAASPPVSAQSPSTPQPRNEWQPFVNGMLDIASSELSAALTKAYATHITSARPLPDEVKHFLHGIVPDEFIENARFTVSNDSLTLPGILNQGHRAYMNQDNAVSINNLIIFSREPTFVSATDARWWAHELGHHMQYKRWGGVPGFARQYVLDFQGVEREAETYGEQAIKKYVDEH